MKGIVINVDPVALNLGHLHVTWYGIVVSLAMVAAGITAIREGKKKGIPSEQVMSLLPWAIVGGVAGARLFHVVDHWEYYLSHPFQIAMIQRGGLAIWGALAGGAGALGCDAPSLHRGHWLRRPQKMEPPFGATPVTMPFL